MNEHLPFVFRYGDRIVASFPENALVAVTRRDTPPVCRDSFAAMLDDQLEVRAELTTYRDFPVREWVVYLTNKGSRPTPVVEGLKVADMEFRGASPRLFHGNGDNVDNAYSFFTDDLARPLGISPGRGTSCCGAFPYMRLLLADRMYNIAIGWTGEWQADFTPTTGGVRLAVGQKRSHYRIMPGETMRSPTFTLMEIGGADENVARNTWRRWCFAHIVPRENGRPLPPMLVLHNWMAEGKPEFTAATEANQCGALRAYLDNGLRPDIWWIDAGWYPCDYDWCRLGDWRPDPARFPRGLAPIGRMAEENGARFLLWFEPERVRSGEPLAVQHPEWMLKSPADPGNLLLNLAIPECRAYITDVVDALVKDGKVRFYRQDFNVGDAGAFWREAESEDRIGAVENLHIQGYLRFWDDLRARNPGLLIDSCASGGRRNDLDTMRRAVTLHYTDIGYGHHPIKQKQHRQMFEWIPYFRGHNMSWDNRETGEYGGWTNGELDEFSYMNALAPALTDMTHYTASPQAFALARKMCAVWREAAALELAGDYYPLTECRGDRHDWFAMQFDDEQSGRGFVQFIRNNGAEADSFTVFPHVREGQAYTFTDALTGHSFTMTTAELKSGLTVSVPRRAGRVLFYGSVARSNT